MDGGGAVDVVDGGDGADVVAVSGTDVLADGDVFGDVLESLKALFEVGAGVAVAGGGEVFGVGGVLGEGDEVGVGVLSGVVGR